MSKTILFIATGCYAACVSAQALTVDVFSLDSLHLNGSNCHFGAQRATLIASDWDKIFWMKIDGKMVEFQSKKTDAEIEKQMKTRRWHERHCNRKGLPSTSTWSKPLVVKIRPRSGDLSTSHEVANTDMF